MNSLFAVRARTPPVSFKSNDISPLYLKHHCSKLPWENSLVIRVYNSERTIPKDKNSGHYLQNIHRIVLWARSIREIASSVHIFLLSGKWISGVCFRGHSVLKCSDKTVNKGVTLWHACTSTTSCNPCSLKSSPIAYQSLNYSSQWLIISQFQAALKDGIMSSLIETTTRS